MLAYQHIDVTQQQQQRRGKVTATELSTFPLELLVYFGDVYVEIGAWGEEGGMGGMEL